MGQDHDIRRASGLGHRDEGEGQAGKVVENAITSHQGNHFSNNTYHGPWEFMVYDQAGIVSFAIWRHRWSEESGSMYASWRARVRTAGTASRGTPIVDRRLKPMKLRASMVRLAKTASGKVLRNPVVGPAARGFSDIVAGAPRGSAFRLFVPLRSMLKGEVTANRVLEIIDVLEGSGVHCCLAGGWGVDALVGHQTRRHDDVDIVIDDFARCAPTACEALSPIGFHLIERHQHSAWMPDQWILVLEDAAASLIDLLTLDWDLLTEATTSQQVLPEPTSRDHLFAGVIEEGTVGGRRVLCLSAPVQRLLYSRFEHSGYEPRPVHRHNLAILKVKEFA